MKKPLAIAAFVTVCCVGPGLAADVNATKPYDWRGWYVGAQIGDLWSQTDLFNGATLVDSNANTTGIVGGIEYGYNFQSGNWVYGSESDFGLSNAIGQSSLPLSTYNMDWDSHSRVRLGYAPDEGPLLLYVVGGLAIANLSFTQGGARKSAMFYGGSAGIGAEYGFSQKISGQLEYNYDDYAMFGGQLVSGANDAHLKNASTIRAAINFHF